MRCRSNTCACELSLSRCCRCTACHSIASIVDEFTEAAHTCLGELALRGIVER